MSPAQNILITGANGYLGAQISQNLALKGHSITALCYPNIPNDSKWCELMEEVIVGSIAERSIIEQLKIKSFDTIIHLVSLDYNQSKIVSPEISLSINVNPCWMLLESFKDNSLKTFIYFSTIHVYGDIPNTIITEQQPVKPNNIYALTHALCEQICEYYNRTTNINCISLRLSNSYGSPIFPENNCWWLAVNNLCQTSFYEKSIRLLTDGSPMRDFIHGRDVCQAVELLFESGQKKFENNTYHISSNKTYTLLELAGFVKDIYQEIYGDTISVSSIKEKEISNFRLYTDRQHYQIDNSSIKSLGFEPKFDIKKGIRELFYYLDEL